MADAERFYTVEQARALLPQVRAILLQLAVARHEAERVNAGDVLALLEHLNGLGVVLRDIDAGLVDFPTLRDGEPAWLCWRLEDPALEHWHTTREGFASRKPL